MGLFNNLRHRIVEKLIRPEDGYMHMNESVKFYYDESTGKYILCMKTEDGYYLEPTLTGWANANTYSTGLKEIEFKKWIHGVLDNICSLYFERLDNISLKELRSLQSFRKEENEGSFVINKQSFCEIMEGLDAYWKNLRKLEDVLNVYFEENMMTEILDTVMNALEEDLEPDVDNEEYYPTIFTWLFSFDAGRDDKAKEGIDGHPLTSAEELYDYLVWKRDSKPVPPVGSAVEDA